MTEADWNSCTDPQRMLEFLRGKVSDRKVRLFAVECCRQVWHLLDAHEPARKAISGAERFLDGEISRHELHELWHQAYHHVSWSFDGSLSGYPVEYLASKAARYPAEWAKTAVIEPQHQVDLLRCVFGPLPFRTVDLDGTWLSSTVVQLATSIYDERSFGTLPILGDALEEAGCDDAEILRHCRGPGPHVRGCWVVDIVLDQK